MGYSPLGRKELDTIEVTEYAHTCLELFLFGPPTLSAYTPFPRNLQQLPTFHTHTHTKAQTQVPYLRSL